MSWIKRKLGITELIKQQKQTNKLLEKVIKLEKLNINNLRRPITNRYEARQIYKQWIKTKRYDKRRSNGLLPKVKRSS